MLKYVLLLSLVFVQGDEGSSGRVGQCPLVAPGTIGTCIAACQSDDTCPRGQKCCSNGCGRTCQPVVAVGGCVCGQPCTMEGGGSGVCQADYKTCAVNIQAPQCGGGGTVHPGQCPILAPGTVGICIHGCSNDGNCAKDEKCCSNGCGRTCQKVGSSSACVCGQPCKMAGGGSGVCQADRKTCAVNIQAPQCGGEHPGSCPYVERDTLGICVDRCSSDDSCEKGEKCCFNGCGKSCTKPGNSAGCVCGTPCKMSGGGSGVCQDDNKTCAVNVMAPQCGGKGKGKGNPKGKFCRKLCPQGQRCINGACTAN